MPFTRSDTYEYCMFKKTGECDEDTVGKYNPSAGV